MKKKIFIIVILVICIILSYFIYVKISFKNLVNNTIEYKDKINYSSSITTTLKGVSTLKIEYEIIKTSNAKKILISDYRDGKLENKIEKYIVNNKVYALNNGKYEVLKKNNDKVNINYKLLKKGKVISRKKNTYKIKIKSYDAYNLIYEEEIMTKKNLNSNIVVTIIKDDKNDFIKEITYEIDDLSKDIKNPLKYKIKIINTDINNHNEIKLPF